MPYKDRRYWLTYNGEIYNHIELRAEVKIAWLQLRVWHG
ncbi:MAG: hypothetical protein R3D66_01250 [Alphaproteobacteria bacterium]